MEPGVSELAFENSDPAVPESQHFGGYWTENRTATDAPGATHEFVGQEPRVVARRDHVDARRDRVRREDSRPFLDISQVLVDPADPDPAMRWKAYGQIFVPRPDGTGWPGIRNIGLAHGSDVSRVEDAHELVVLAPEEGIDEELHFAAVRKIGGTYVMLFESDRFSRNPIHGDLRLAVSTDGRTFRRVHPRAPLVVTGPKGMWDENLLVTNSAGWQEVGDELYLHYFGCPNLYNSWPAQYAVSADRRGSQFAPSYLGLATLPRDRFAYATATDAQGPGQITTHAMTLTGSVWLNAEGDALAVIARSPEGTTRASGKLGTQRNQGVYRKVEWADSPPRPGFYQLDIALGASDRLFSIRV